MREAGVMRARSSSRDRRASALDLRWWVAQASRGASPRLRLRLTLALVFGCALGAFIDVVEDYLTNDPIVHWDVSFSRWLHVHSNPTLFSAFNVVAWAGSIVVLAAVTAVVAFVLARQHRLFDAMFLCAAAIGIEVVNTILKFVLDRPRPQLPHMHLDTHAFPSGHAAGATAIYALATYLLVRRASNRTRLLGAVGVVLLVTLVGFSRMYLEVRYLSDVLAGTTLGIAWAAGALFLLETIEPSQRLARPSFVRRAVLDDMLDHLRFRVDSFPRSEWLSRYAGSGVHYQPIEELGLDEGTRADGTRSRWHEIENVLDGCARTPASAVDIGASTGFFTRRLAGRGIPTMAVEPAPFAYRTALLAIRRSKLDAKAGVLVLPLDSENIALLPPADVVLFFSLWHHFARFHGVDGATELLEGIWTRTRGLLFFDTGENEMPDEFGLPAMAPDARTWLARYLADHCLGGTVEHLGVHQAFDADGRTAMRNLFVVRRAGWAVLPRA